MAGVQYGIVLASLMMVLGEWAPQPAGTILLWTLLSLQLAVGTWIAWRRLRLRWFSAGGMAALYAAVSMIDVSARGLTMKTMVIELPHSEIVAFWLAVACVPVSIGIESWRNAPAWRAFSARLETASLWDVLRFHHIPHAMRDADLGGTGQAA